jgi:hypothetical protein
MRFMFSALFIFALLGTAAAQDTTLQQYVGKYTFPAGSFVTAADIELKENVLHINSVEGSSPLEKKAKDTFALTAYGGMAYFLRNGDGKVTGVKVEVHDILLEGTKEVTTAWLQRNRYFVAGRSLSVK